ncbi:hypothetical protein T4D_9237 [Trichinella pseudospiralis]|uniref:Uncharacterized protein n=1 Tax=Trichinella pseudospiralis TaxID=6337 RepID=A0A0V1FHS0_TRIPS|nr:hypothetical protein T4D_9237 [Trichinella pseudospiralis]
MEKQTMIVVGARSLNPLGVRHIGLECLGQGSAAHLCCLRRSVWLLLIVFVSIRDQWPVGWLAVAHLRPSQISGMFTVFPLVRKRISWCKCKFVGLIEHWIGIRPLRNRPVEMNNLRHMFNVR